MNIRLSPKEFHSLSESLENIQDEVFLYGSRTDIDKKGWDIDVLLISDQTPKETLEKKLLVTRIFQRNTDQKIDVTILPSKRDENQERFFRSLSKVERWQIKTSYKIE